MSMDTCLPLFAFGSRHAVPGQFAVPYRPTGASDLDYGVPRNLAKRPERARWFDELEPAMRFAASRAQRHGMLGNLEYPGVTRVYHPGHEPDMEDPFTSEKLAA